MVNGSFTTYAANQSVPQFEWSIRSGNINHGTGPAGTVCASGSQCVDLNGSVPGAIEQDFPTPEGGNCTVSFQMSHHKNLTSATLYPTIGDVDQAPITHNVPGVSTSDGKWEWKSFAFVAAGPTTRVGFRSQMPGAAGPQIDNVSVGCRPTGIVKVCKVAGALVPVGQPFTFSADKGAPFTVPAGPAPGGYCMIAGRYPVGHKLVVTEAASSGSTATAIGVVPSNRLVAPPNLSSRTVVVAVGTGVTEVTFTNSTVEKTGFIEICKQLTGPVGPGANRNFRFDVPGVPGGVTVPAGACSPALQVPAGQITVAEQASTGSVLSSCSTLPSTALVSCSTGAGTATVSVVPGGQSSQTIVNFVNVANSPPPS